MHLRLPVLLRAFLTLQASHELTGTEDDHGLVSAKLQELPVSRAEDGGLAAQCGGQSQIVLGLRCHTYHRDGQLGHDGLFTQQFQCSLSLPRADTGSVVGIQEDPPSSARMCSAATSSYAPICQRSTKRLEALPTLVKPGASTLVSRTTRVTSYQWPRVRAPAPRPGCGR